MIRIGIVGSDNSHADQFAQRCNLPEHPQRVEGARVVAICGAEPKRTLEVQTNAKIDEIVDSPKKMLGKIDAAMVVYRHGGLHLENAKPLIQAGLPVFVDKPLACSVKEAKKLVELANKKNVALTSFSTVRLAQCTKAFIKDQIPQCGQLFSATFTGPSDPNSEYGGIFFYGIHPVEMMIEFLGTEIEDVTAVRAGMNTIVTCRYRSGVLGILELLPGANGFTALVNGKSGNRFFPYDHATAYSDGLRTILDMFQTKVRPYTDEQLLASPRVLEAIDKSVKAKGRPKPF